MTKVYVLTSGDYSDRCIEGVFSTREKAEQIKNRSEFASYHDVLEFELDGMVGREFGIIHRAQINLDTGEIYICPSYYGLRHPSATTIEDVIHHEIAVQSPISPEHAAKVAVEHRQGWLRTRA